MTHWLADNLNWILSGIGISCAFCLWLLCKKIIWRFLSNMLTRRTAVVLIRLSSELRPYRTNLGLLHVRDGKDELTDRDIGPLLNKPRKVSEAGENAVRAKVRFPKHLGFQFKLFLNLGDSLSYEHAKHLLEEAGYVDVTPGGGVRNRVWFIHPDYPTCNTKDGFTNNFYYPQ